MQKLPDRDLDVSAVSALVTLMLKSGIGLERIEATLLKTTAPADLDAVSACYRGVRAAARSRAKRAA